MPSLPNQLPQPSHAPVTKQSHCQSNTNARNFCQETVCNSSKLFCWTVAGLFHGSVKSEKMSCMR